LLSASAIASTLPGAGARSPGLEPTMRMAMSMSERRRERIGIEHRLRTSLDYAAVKRDGRALRGKHCLLLAAPTPGEPTRVGFIASKKGVGGAVERNRARRRLREIVRRRWPRIESRGWALAFIAYRTAVTAPHDDLVADVECLLADAGALPKDPLA
jgi:ribonuclease P protein component